MVSHLKFLLIKGVKNAAKKKSFWANFAILSRICLVSVFLTPFMVFLPPLPKVQCQNFFWFLEYLGEYNAKKWSQIWTLLLMKSEKWPRQKSFYRFFFHLFTQFKLLFPPLPKVQCPNFLDFQTRWGKEMKRSGLRFENFCYKGCKIAAPTPKKNLSFSVNFALIAGFFWYRCYYPHSSRDALSPVCGIFEFRSVLSA